MRDTTRYMPSNMCESFFIAFEILFSAGKSFFSRLWHGNNAERNLNIRLQEKLIFKKNFSDLEDFVYKNSRRANCRKCSRANRWWRRGRFWLTSDKWNRIYVYASSFFDFHPNSVDAFRASRIQFSNWATYQFGKSIIDIVPISDIIIR